MNLYTQQEEIRIVNSVNEITECGIKYAHVSSPKKWIQIDQDGEKEFSVYGMVSGDQPTSITTSNWNQVKNWKTFNGVIRSLNKYVQNRSWGMFRWDSELMK